MIKVDIGVQARSTSTRLPGKSLKKIGNKTILEMVLDSANYSSNYLNMYTSKSRISSSVTVLTVKDDPIVEFCNTKEINCISGDEFDVLSRYKALTESNDSSYIVRITADCPFIPSAYISKAINTAIKNNLDYCSNVDPRFRTSPDGFDVEVISRRAMEWLFKNAKSEEEKEHVTLKLRTNAKPSFFSVGVIIGHVDLSNIKLSIDTEADLQIGNIHYDNLNDKINQARQLYGERCVHRF